MTGTTSIVHVTRKVQADLVAVLDMYEYYADGYAKKLIHDIRVFLDEEVIEKIKFVWTAAGTATVLDELEYVVLAGSYGLADDRSGGIGYVAALQTADFDLRIVFNKRWKQLSAAQQATIRNGLDLTWSAANALDYSSGYFVSDRTYSLNGSDGLARRRFVKV